MLSEARDAVLGSNGLREFVLFCRSSFDKTVVSNTFLGAERCMARVRSLCLIKEDRYAG